MIRMHRFVLTAASAAVLVVVSGCFLPFFGGKKEPKIPEPAAQAKGEAERAVVRNPGAAADALRRAEQAVENQSYETAVIEYTRALRADSTNASTYFALARLHQQLSEQYREAGKLDEALREHTRAVSVLAAYVTSQLEPGAAARAAVPSATPQTPATPSAPTTPAPATSDSLAPSSQPPP